MKRIFKIGFIELWGKEREKPNDFTRLADAVEDLKRAIYDEIFEPVLKFLNKLIFNVK